MNQYFQYQSVPICKICAYLLNLVRVQSKGTAKTQKNTLLTIIPNIMLMDKNAESAKKFHRVIDCQIEISYNANEQKCGIRIFVT